MSLTAFALSAALLGGQDPATHQQAVTCTGVFLFVNIVTSAAAESDPTPDNQQLNETAAKLMKAADDDRLAAARREGLTTDQSGQALNAWLEANIPNSEAVLGAEFQPCFDRYASAV
ncbi:MAG: hypothetical protein K2X07_06695 [Caulobacteraceae bacterium]|nr:hypothetical protein [Caulobacteraceae bacterium]